MAPIERKLPRGKRCARYSGPLHKKTGGLSAPWDFLRTFGSMQWEVCNEVRYGVFVNVGYILCTLFFARSVRFRSALQLLKFSPFRGFKVSYEFPNFDNFRIIFEENLTIFSFLIR